MSETRPRTNPDARDPDDVLGTSLPDTVSSCTWKRPYKYLLVRVDEDRLSHLDDHEHGRIIRTTHIRKHAAADKAIFSRRNPDRSYEIHAEPNPNYGE